MPGDILLHLTVLSHAASPSVARLDYFQGLREVCDTVSCRVGGPCKNVVVPVVLTKSMKNYSWGLRQPSPESRQPCTMLRKALWNLDYAFNLLNHNKDEVSDRKRVDPELSN
jgi:hypothetical protein